MVSYMGQLTIYLPDEVEKRVRREVRRRKTTVSAYIARLADGDRRDAKGWPEGYEELFGSCKDDPLIIPEADIPRIPRLGPQVPARQRRLRRVPKRR